MVKFKKGEQKKKAKREILEKRTYSNFFPHFLPKKRVSNQVRNNLFQICYFYCDETLSLSRDHFLFVCYLLIGKETFVQRNYNIAARKFFDDLMDNPFTFKSSNVSRIILSLKKHGSENSIFILSLLDALEFQSNLTGLFNWKKMKSDSEESNLESFVKLFLTDGNLAKETFISLSRFFIAFHGFRTNTMIMTKESESFENRLRRKQNKKRLVQEHEVFFELFSVENIIIALFIALSENQEEILTRDLLTYSQNEKIEVELKFLPSCLNLKQFIEYARESLLLGTQLSVYLETSLKKHFATLFEACFSIKKLTGSLLTELLLNSDMQTLHCILTSLRCLAAHPFNQQNQNVAKSLVESLNTSKIPQTCEAKNKINAAVSVLQNHVESQDFLPNSLVLIPENEAGI